MEKRPLLHYIWKNRLCNNDALLTSSGDKIEVYNTGESSADCKSFNDACITIAGEELRGCIIVEPSEEDIPNDGSILCIASPQNRAADICRNVLYIEPGNTFEQEFQKVFKGKFPCYEEIAATDSLHTSSYLSRLLSERMEEKSARIAATHLIGDKRWEETLFRILARNFGFGIQSDAFEKWAELLNLAALGKHRDNLLQVEAVFFGQAGLLETESIPDYYRSEAERAPYYNELKREYKFLSAKFGLQQADYNIWKSCGNSVPHTRIARLATIFHNGNITLSNIAECDTLDELKRLLQTPLGGYWSNHSLFGSTTATGKPETISTKHLNLFIINTIAPILYAYGKHRRDNALCNKAEDFLHRLPVEDNGIIRGWEKIGLHARCAADTQALIQLKKEYCNRGRCIDCMFAYRHLKEAFTPK